MRFRILSLLAMLIFLTGTSISHAQSPVRYLSVVDDLPLFESLFEVGEGVVFSSPQGRIAEVLAQGETTGAKVLAFYQATLPQLGWTTIDNRHYERESELLTLSLETKNDRLQVRFAFKPTGK